MAQGSSIEWTEATWNPIAGCTPVSPGCLNCYAAKMANRLEAMGQEKYVGLTVKRNRRYVFNGKISFDESALSVPLKRKKPTMYFVNSMSDLFHEDVPTYFIQKVFRVMGAAPQHTFQVLTKRGGRMAEEVRRWVHGCGHGIIKNGWFGVSVEDQANADKRIPELLSVPAAVRFLSCEPLIGPVDLSIAHSLEAAEHCELCESNPSKIGWVIVGGESGPHARPCNIEWVRSIVKQCEAAGVAVFCKQLGTVLARELKSDDTKGGDLKSWPTDIRVREFPQIGGYNSRAGGGAETPSGPEHNGPVKEARHV